MSYESPDYNDARIDVRALLAAMIGKLPRIALVTVGLLVVTFVILMFQPRLYQSSASILVEPRSATEQTNVVITGNATGVVSSQMELIRSRDTLVAVVDQLDLRSVPEFNGSSGGFSPLGMIMQLAGRGAAAPESVDETVIRTLNQRLSVAQQRDSGIITISVMSTDPQLAADIANAVADAHVARRAGLSISDTAVTSGWLLGEIERLRQSVTEAETAVADFRVNNDLMAGQGNTSLLDQQLSTVAGQIAAAQERQNTAAARAALIRGLLDRGQSIEGLADVQSSPIIQQLSQEKARVQGELAQRSATLLSNHPTIRSLNAQLSQLNEQIRIEGQRVAASLDAEAQVQADLVTSLDAQLDQSKSTASTATLDTVTLDSLEREAKAQRDLLEAYLLRYNEAASRVEANGALPDVRVVSEAAPSITPASPNTTLIMTGVAIASVAIQLGAVAFGELMSGRSLIPAVRPARPQDELEEAPFHSEELEPNQRWDEDEVAAVEPEEVAEEPEIIAPEPLVVINEAPAPVVRPVAEDDDSLDAARSFIRGLMDNPRPVADVEPEMDADPAPVVEPMPAAAGTIVPFDEILSDLVLGRTNLLLLADCDPSLPSHDFAEDLVGSALSKGLSVALIDAGTGRRTTNAGLSDLSTGAASFGDVVQKSADHSFAEVTWGQGAVVDPTSPRPLTLIEALGDIYEVVVVLAGHVGRTSMLSRLTELGGRVVLVAGDETSPQQAEAARQQLRAAGLTRVDIAASAASVAA
jgi:polysaccharide biosynthesis transport protein